MLFRNWLKTYGIKEAILGDPKSFFSSCSSRRKYFGWRRGSSTQEGNEAAEEQGGGAGVPEKKEGVHQVPGEPGGRAREPKQGAHRRAQVAQGAVLPAEDRLRSVRRSAALGYGAGRY